MINGEARMLEPESMFFAAETVQKEKQNETVIEETGEIKLEAATNNNAFQTRFARLKKSLRRRSASIL